MERQFGAWIARLGAALAIGLLLAGPAGAQTLREVDSYMDSLRNRIERGQRSGQLSAQESSRLKSLYGIIESARGKFQDDGRVSKDERRRLMQSLTSLDKAIWEQMRDDEVASWRDWDEDRGEWRRPPSWNRPSQGSGQGHGIATLQEIDRYLLSLKLRISLGERSGKLGEKEARVLNSMHNVVLSARRKFDDDGRVSRDERKRLMDSLTALDKGIWDQMHDDDQSRWRDWDSGSGQWRRSQNWGN